MLEASRQNFIIAEQENDWFKSEFVEFKKGDALNLPIEDESIDRQHRTACSIFLRRTI
jgi:ubiquinone/menaquinone biosynthesis C-methylase UbiE